MGRPTLVRAAVEAEDRIARIVVLCIGCATTLSDKMRPEGLRIRTKEYGTGSGYCEFCEDEVFRNALYGEF